MRNNGVLLIEPPYYRLFHEDYSLNRLPLSLGYLAATAQAELKRPLTVYNADFSPRNLPITLNCLYGEGFTRYLERLADAEYGIWREVREAVSACRPGVVGISTKSQNFASSRVVARIVKSLNPETVVVAGGPHATIAPENVLAEPAIDVAVQGEGERTFVELLKADTWPPVGIAGTCYRRDGQVVRNPPREFIQDLDSLPYPHQARAWLKDAELYPPEAFANVFASRGCPYDCFYCGSRNLWSRRVRHRSPGNIAGELRALRQLGCGPIRFEDDTFGVTRANVEATCADLGAIEGLEWTCETHVNLVDEALVRRMRQAGCYEISLGIESGNDEMLRRIRKNFTIEKALAACRMVRRAGIRLSTFFMVGFPWETAESLDDTWRAMRECGSERIAFSIFTPYPGTEAFTFCREHGLIGEDFDVGRYNHQSPDNFFCLGMARDEFRGKVARTVALVERMNRYRRMRRLISPRTLMRKARKTARAFLAPAPPAGK